LSLEKTNVEIISDNKDKKISAMLNGNADITTLVNNVY
jgi:hypothetical protein